MKNWMMLSIVPITYKSSGCLVSLFVTCLILFWNSEPRNAWQGCRVSDQLRFKRNWTVLDTITEDADPHSSMFPWSVWIYTCMCLEQGTPRPSLIGKMTICCYCSCRAFWEIAFVLNWFVSDLLGLS